MAAVRCLARRLGGTLAAAAEGRRQLVPRRFVSEHAHEMKQKMRKQKVEELYDALYKRGEIPTTSPSVQASQEPDPLRTRRYAMRIRGVFDLAAKMTLGFMLVAYAVSPKLPREEDTTNNCPQCGLRTSTTREGTTNN
ncbi:hypothetical protein CFC21_004531 [Triticum aestivum]|uniref:Uncharacterized protein n=1 Tax=Triticum aestivum TaxID=4565 RepID=A0A3B5Y7W9_WHEAT|nr:uncharacterized protein LOC119349406 [Triticum dicoccoides]XP_044452053.1 uncharacterized protein LOC123183329 [Triticum aestivum]KAF6986812.1 hypothetical protein CFC21_004531 [Triticum aestivum]